MSNLILPDGLLAARPNRAARRAAHSFPDKQHGADPLRHRKAPALPQEGQLQLTVGRSDDAIVLNLLLGDKIIQIPMPPMQAEAYGVQLIGLAGQVRHLQAETEAEPESTPEQDAAKDRMIAELMAERRPTVVADAVTDSPTDDAV